MGIALRHGTATLAAFMATQGSGPVGTRTAKRKRSARARARDGGRSEAKDGPAGLFCFAMQSGRHAAAAENSPGLPVARDERLLLCRPL